MEKKEESKINWVAIGVLLAAAGLFYEIRRDRKPKAVRLIYPKSVKAQKIEELELKGKVLSWEIRNDLLHVRWLPNNDAARSSVMQSQGLMKVGRE